MPQFWVTLFRENDYDPATEDAAMIEDIETLNAEMVAAGIRIFVGGLRPPRNAKSVRTGSDEKTEVVDGPYLTATEQVGGFWVVEAADMDEALKWGRKAAIACRAPVEVRPFH